MRDDTRKVKRLVAPAMFGMALSIVHGPARGQSHGGLGATPDFSMPTAGLGGAGTDLANQQLQTLAASYNTREDALESQLARATFEKGRCAMDAASAMAQLKSQESAAIAGTGVQFVQGVAGGLGNLADKAFSTASSAREVAKRTITEISKRYASGSGLCIMRDGYLAVNPSVATQYVKDQCPVSENPLSQSSCENDARRSVFDQCASESSRYQAAIRDSQGADEVLSAGNQLAVQAGITALGAGLGHWARTAPLDAQKKNTKANQEMCEQQADLNLANIRRSQQRLAEEKSRALTNLALQLAYQANRQPQSGPTTATPNLGEPMQSVAKAEIKPFGAGSGGGSGGGAAAGGGGGGAGGGSPGSPSWLYGSGVNNSGLSDSLPPNPQGATFGGDAGGGGGGFGGFGFGDVGAGGFDGGGAGSGFGGFAASGLDAPALGDGGLNVLLNRARSVYGRHAGLLVRSLQAPAPSLGKADSSKNFDRSPAGKSTPSPVSLDVKGAL